MDLRGGNAVVTGAASGIGRGLATRLAEEGMNVVLADRRTRDLDEVVATLREVHGGAVHGVAVDVTRFESVRALASACRDLVGEVHLLCNNAGVIRPALTWDDLDDAREVMDVNYWGVVHGLHAFLPGMLRHGAPAHVVNTASVAGLVPLPGFPSYCASKYAVVGMSESLVLDLEQEGHAHIGVSVLCPGGVASSIFALEAERRSVLPELGLGERQRQQLTGLADPERKGRYLPATVAAYVVDAVRRKRFYVLPMQAELREMVSGRLRRLDAALAEVPDLPVTD